jgi:hypothetical protein
MLLSNGEITPPWGTPRLPDVLRISFSKCRISPSRTRRATFASSKSCRTLSKYAAKTQGSLPTEDAALVLLFGLVASGQIRLRRLDGWRQIPALLREHRRPAA